MPLTPDMRRAIDQVRDHLFAGGHPDPVSNPAGVTRQTVFGQELPVDASKSGRSTLKLSQERRLADASRLERLVSEVIGPSAPQIAPKKHAVALGVGTWQGGARHRRRPM